MAAPAEVPKPPVPGSPLERYRDGWRSGKPVEDPDKLKRWGYIGAKPSEYLVVTRNGEIDRERSGQGVRIFKWPSDSVAIVPTTLQRIEFLADQVTRERIGVEITGVAVYRIAEPELAFRVLNFSYGEAASEKLGATLREMFVGAARRLVGNLPLEECLSRRKEAIAKFLMEEIAPVVSGEGALSDSTTRGWGVVIDTIEIQSVRIQSNKVFEHLQAPYRAEIAAKAQLAELERTRAVTERRAETQAREAELAANAARQAAELERDRRLHASAIAQQQIEADAARVEAEHRAKLIEIERQQSVEELVHVSRRRAAELLDFERAMENGHERRQAELELMLAQSRTLRDLVTKALPQLAHAMQQQIGTLSVTQIGSGTGDVQTLLPNVLGQILAVLRTFGLEPKR